MVKESLHLSKGNELTELDSMSVSFAELNTPKYKGVHDKSLAEGENGIPNLLTMHSNIYCRHNPLSNVNKNSDSDVVSLLPQSIARRPWQVAEPLLLTQNNAKKFLCTKRTSSVHSHHWKMHPSSEVTLGVKSGVGKINDNNEGCASFSYPLDVFFPREQLPPSTPFPHDDGDHPSKSRRSQLPW